MIGALPDFGADIIKGSMAALGVNETSKKFSKDGKGFGDKLWDNAKTLFAGENSKTNQETMSSSTDNNNHKSKNNSFHKNAPKTNLAGQPTKNHPINQPKHSGIISKIGERFKLAEEAMSKS